MTSLDELERELGPHLRASYRDQLPRWEHGAAELDTSRQRGDRPPRSARSHGVVGVAAGLVVLLSTGLIWANGRPGDSTQPNPTPGQDGPASTETRTDTTLVSTTASAGTTVAPASATDPIQTSALSQTLAQGMYGSEVEMVQQRLSDLGFFPGPIDGMFGSLTTQAVWAFEKLVLGIPRSEATGQVTPEMWEHMNGDVEITPRRATDADHVEIYLPEQVMVVFDADQPVVIAHISTGALADGATAFTPWSDNAAEYCETITIDTDIDGNLLGTPEDKSICGWSYTPPGVFTAHRMVEGKRIGPLGAMWDPIYINQGIAIHGAANVPLEPASHGSIRVSRALADVLPTFIEPGDQVMIWDGQTEPEGQPAEAMHMRWDYVDPDSNATISPTVQDISCVLTERAPLRQLSDEQIDALVEYLSTTDGRPAAPGSSDGNSPERDIAPIDTCQVAEQQLHELTDEQLDALIDDLTARQPFVA
jgi:hypothetical protein